MGRWDDDWHYEGKHKKSRDWIRIARYAIYGGFAIVAIVVLLVFIPRAGLTVEIMESGEALTTISIKINNNNPQEIHNVTVVFDNDTNRKQIYNSMAPFQLNIRYSREGRSRLSKNNCYSRRWKIANHKV